MSIKTEVAAILSAVIHNAKEESETYANLKEYGMSDKIDRVVEGLQLARQLYVDYVAPATPSYVIPESLLEFLQTAPKGSTIRYIGETTPYAVGDGKGGWLHGSGEVWTSDAFGDTESFLKEVPRG